MLPGEHVGRPLTTGTLGQLEHGVNYAEAYLHTLGIDTTEPRALDAWPYAANTPVKLFVLAGHRNMEGERAFMQDLLNSASHQDLLAEDLDIAYRYNVGGGAKVSAGWEPLGPAGPYDTFGPELSFAAQVKQQPGNIAIAKFTHSGSQIIDWTPQGSEAVSRNLYPTFISFIQETIADREAKGHDISLEGICYHVDENDMSWGPFRRAAPERVMALVNATRIDLDLPELRWFISQQSPTDDPAVNEIDVTADLEQAFAADPRIVHIKAYSPPPQETQLVLNTAGVIYLGEQLAKAALAAAPE